MKMFNKPTGSPNRHEKKLTVEEHLQGISKTKNSKKLCKDELRSQKKMEGFQKIQEELVRLDQERAVRLESIKKSIEDGSYHVSGKNIAEKMINDSILYPTPRI